MVKRNWERRVCNFYGAPTEISAPGKGAGNPRIVCCALIRRKREESWVFRTFPFCFLHNRLVYIIFINPHLHLHRRRVICELSLSKMIKEKQYAKSDSNRIRNLQNGKSTGNISCNKSVNLGKKTSHIYVIVKVSIIEKAAPKKVARQTKITFSHLKRSPWTGSF